MLSRILEIENITPKNKISPLLYSKIESLYDREEYDMVISHINSEFYEENYIDISFLIILICSHLFKSEDLFVDIDSLYKDLNTVIDKYGSSLSPVENFENYANKSFTRLNKVILYFLNKNSYLNIEFEQLNTILDSINLFNKKFKEIYRIDLTTQKSFINMYKFFFAQREALKLEINNSEDLSQNDQANASTETLISKNKDISKSRVEVESKYDIRKIASLDWFRLVEKLNMLKFTMKNKGILEQSIIYYDIQNELRKFDPKKYFPGLFFDVYSSMSNKARDIYNFINKNKNTVEWHLTEQLYQFDKKRFLKNHVAIVNTQENEPQDFGMFEDNLEQINEGDKTLMNDLHNMTDSQDITLDTGNDSDEQSNISVDDLVSDLEQDELDSIIDDIEHLFQ